MEMDPDTVVTYLGYLVAAMTAVISLYRSHKAGQSFSQALLVLVNTLKDEEKMIGGQFAPKTLEKAEEVAVAIGANDVAIEQARQALRGRELDIKLGSLRGKPVFLSDALKLGGIAEGLKKMLKR